MRPINNYYLTLIRDHRGINVMNLYTHMTDSYIIDVAYLRQQVVNTSDVCVACLPLSFLSGSQNQLYSVVLLPKASFVFITT